MYKTNNNKVLVFLLLTGVLNSYKNTKKTGHLSINLVKHRWSNATTDMIKKLQVAQNRATRVVICRNIRTNVIAMRDVLNW